MFIQDSLYGNFTLEPVLSSLINTSTVQRLKHIHQGGASYLVNPNWNITRYEHSIGVMLLIRILGGSIEEQIAGLLHDISHTAFSHVVDFAMDNSKEDYHEDIFETVLKNSHIPNILQTHGYDYTHILEDETKWTILEKPSPDLCADRIDYTLRDMFHYNFISKEEVTAFLKVLNFSNGHLYITSIDQAQWFVETYYKEVIDFFMNPLNVYAYQKLSLALKTALKLNKVTLSDLLKTDEEMIDLLKNTSTEVLNLVDSITPSIKVIEDCNNYDFYQINKLRIIDPYVLYNNNLVRISEISQNVRDLNESAIKKSKAGTYVKRI